MDVRDLCVDRDTDFWTTLTYEALAFVRRDSATLLPLLPDERAPDVPDDIRGYRFMRAPKPVPGRVLVNADAHLFGVVNRSHRIAPHLLELLTPLYGVLLHSVPADFIEGNTWSCPQDGCTYYEDLDNLSPRAVAAVRDVQPTPSTGEASLVSEGLHTRANYPFQRLVTDIFGLRHYQAHLRAVGLICVIYGQDFRGDVDYEWSYADYQTVLTSLTAEGAAARMYEENERVQLQRRISLLSRRSALRTLTAAPRDRKAQVASLRASLADSAREAHDRALLEDLDLWQEACAAHAEFYGTVDARDRRDAQRERDLRCARETMEFWENGEGRLRLLPRDNSPYTYELPEISTTVDV